MSHFGFGFLKAGPLLSSPTGLSTANNLNNNSNTATFSGFPFGTANANRFIIVVLTAYATTTHFTLGFTGVTIGGVTATIAQRGVAATTGAGGAPQIASCIAYAKVPTGTSGNIVATLDGVAEHVDLSHYSVISNTGALTVAYTTGAPQGSAGSSSVFAGLVNDLVIGVGSCVAGATITLTALNMDAQVNLGTTSTQFASGRVSLAASGNITLGFTESPVGAKTASVCIVGFRP